MKHFFIAIWILMLVSTAISQTNLVGHWTFDDPTHLTKADKGNDLVLVGFQRAVTGPDSHNGAVRIGVGSHDIVTHGLAPNGGGQRVNEFSIVMDIRLTAAHRWYTMYQTDVSNQNDGDWFINDDGEMGVGATGYTHYLFDKIGQWYRIAISVKNGWQYNYYSDGVRRLTGTPGSIDGRFSLGSAFLLFADQNGEDNTIDVADVKFFSKALSDDEVAALGGYSHFTVDSTINPYLQTPTATSIYVCWHASPGTESVVEYGTDESLGNTATGSVHVFEDSSRWWHTVKLTNLTPETVYYYKAKTDSFESKIYRFKTQPSNGDRSSHIRFVVLGDNQGANLHEFARIVADLKNTAQKLYGPNIEENINFLFNVGDIVNDGTILSEFKDQYFSPLIPVSANIPVMVSIGNHEREADNYYQYMKYEDFGGAEGEKYYSFKIGRILFIALNSNFELQNDTQISWLDTTLKNAQNDDSIDWIFSFCHHPGHSEICPGGGRDYVQKRIIPTLSKYSKAEIHFYGHTHDYERGALPDGNLRLVESGSAGAPLERWGIACMPQKDYPEIQRTFDYYSYTIIDIDVEKEKYTATTFSLGNEDKPLDNVVIDSFYRDRKASAPPKPTLVSPESGVNKMPPFFVQAEDFSKEYEITSSQFQITGVAGDYSRPVVDKIQNFEDIYEDTGAPNYIPIDLNKNIDLSKMMLTGVGLSLGNTYWWRARYRDKNLQWTEWSDERSFTISSATTAPEPQAAIVKKTELYDNYPNPFNPTTTIKFDIAETGRVSLEIYSLEGKLVKTLLNKRFRPGQYSATWNGTNFMGEKISSGTYFIKLVAGEYRIVKKAVLIK